MNWLRTAASAYSNITCDPQWPKYDVLETTELYEKRRYHSFTCAAYTFMAKTGDEPVMSNLWKVVKYTQGGNVEGKIFKMQLPILVKVRKAVIEGGENQFTLLLILDRDNNIDSLPQSTIDDVFIYHQSEHSFYVRRFGGYAKEADWIRESNALLDLRPELPIVRNEVISACYDMPTKLRNRRNELLIAEITENTTNETTIPVS
jgi:hypothetical protein